MGGRVAVGRRVLAQPGPLGVDEIEDCDRGRSNGDRVLGVRGCRKGSLQALGFAGANVTIPHKQAVIPLCDELDDIARAAGSVNTLVFDEGRILGSSTDGDAVTAQIDADGRRALVLGAGGSARAVVEALGRAGADVTMASRRGPDWPPSVDGYDILVNATPVKEELIVAPHPAMQVVDLAYLSDGRDTALLAAARAVGCVVVVDGRDVVLFQGAASFERWTGLPAPLAAMREALRGA